MTTQQRATTVAATAALALAVAGCGGSGPAGGPAVTVTVTPTVTSAARPAAPGSSSATRAPAVLGSDVKGRTYDFGTVTALRVVRGVPVVTLDRWTWRGLDDAKLARQGVPLDPFTGTPYLNQNAELTYDIPLAEGARILYHHCVAAGEPQQTRSAPIEDMARLAPRENLVLVRLDERGYAVAVDNLPGCPG